MNPVTRLLRSPFFASLFHKSGKLEALGLSLGFPGVLGFKDGKTTKMLGVWAKKDFHHVILESDLWAEFSSSSLMSWQGARQVLERQCFWNIASSDTLHIWMCRTPVWWPADKHRVKFNWIPRQLFSLHNSCPSLSYPLYEGFLH